MKATINSSLLSQLKPGKKPYDVRDDKLTGFLIRVNISGKLLYMVEYGRGKRIQISRVGVITPTQARDRALAILSDASQGLDPRSKSKKKKATTLLEFIKSHYAPWVTEHRKAGAKTLDHLKRCFFKPFGDKPLIELTPALLDQWRTQRLKDGLTTETVNRDIATLKAAISKAVLWGVIEKHPLERLKLLKSDRSIKVRFLSADEELRLREAAISRESTIKTERETANQWRQERMYELLPTFNQNQFVDHLRPMILIAINTGLRRGELFTLKWENVDFERSAITIEGMYAKSGKTRHVPLNSEALQTLRTWRQQSNAPGLVFINNHGQKFDTIKTSWAALLEAAKIKSFRWHDLRHHFASRLVMVGVDLNTVRELLGHADMAMTLRYAHLAPEHKASAVEKLVKINVALTEAA